MTGYTDEMSALQLIEHIAADAAEPSRGKIERQRDDYQHVCRNWLDANQPDATLRISETNGSPFATAREKAQFLAQLDHVRRGRERDLYTCDRLKDADEAHLREQIRVLENLIVELREIWVGAAMR